MACSDFGFGVIHKGSAIKPCPVKHLWPFVFFSFPLVPKTLKRDPETSKNCHGILHSFGIFLVHTSECDGFDTIRPSAILPEEVERLLD